MAKNTPNWQRQYTSTTTGLAAQTAEAGVIIVDATKNTLAVMDGTTAGGHPLAKEALKIKAGSPNVKINGGSEATLGADITINVLPGTVPGGMVLVENPEGQDPGQYLEVSYTDTSGNPAKYYINMSALIDKYLAGAGIKIENNTVNIDAAKFISDIVATGGGIIKDENDKLAVSPAQLISADGGLKVGDDGKLAVDLTALVDTASALRIGDDGKITITLVSADAGNNLKAGADKGVFYPSDLGTL